MRAQEMNSHAGRRYELRFVSLFDSGRGITVPCDERGSVHLDTLSERMRISYFGARARMGRDFAYPIVEPAQDDPDPAEPVATSVRRSRGAY